MKETQWKIQVEWKTRWWENLKKNVRKWSIYHIGQVKSGQRGHNWAHGNKEDSRRKAGTNQQIYRYTPYGGSVMMTSKSSRLQAFIPFGGRNKETPLVGRNKEAACAASATKTSTNREDKPYCRRLAHSRSSCARTRQPILDGFPADLRAHHECW